VAPSSAREAVRGRFEDVQQLWEGDAKLRLRLLPAYVVIPSITSVAAQRFLAAENDLQLTAGIFGTRTTSTGIAARGGGGGGGLGIEGGISITNGPRGRSASIGSSSGIACAGRLVATSSTSFLQRRRESSAGEPESLWLQGSLPPRVREEFAQHRSAQPARSIRPSAATAVSAPSRRQPRGRRLPLREAQPRVASTRRRPPRSDSGTRPAGWIGDLHGEQSPSRVGSGWAGPSSHRGFRVRRLSPQPRTTGATSFPTAATANT